jgi:hypothetical protein
MAFWAFFGLLIFSKKNFSGIFSNVYWFGRYLNYVCNEFIKNRGESRLADPIATCPVDKVPISA